MSRDNQSLQYFACVRSRFIGEESFAEGARIEFTDDPTWIVDPVGKFDLYSGPLFAHNF